MGVMRFVVHPPNLVADWPEAGEAYLSGLDGRIFPTKVEIEGNVLTCRRPMAESAKLNVPWPVEGLGRPILTTTSLRDREEPYLLSLELARGKLSEVRDQWSAWEMSGMTIPDAFFEIQRDAFKRFAHASAVQTDTLQSASCAAQAIERACRAASMLTDAYVIQRMTSIRRSTQQSPGLLGGVLDSAVLTPEGGKLFAQLFNAASIPMSWRQIEPTEGNCQWEEVDALLDYCARHRLILRGGPLIDLGPQGLPDWLAPWKNDFLNLPSFVCDYIETAVARYQSLIRIWEVSAAANVGGALGLGEDHRLALVARTLEAAKRTDSDAQFFIRVERPWGEYQRQGQHRLSPFQFVDALIRSNLGLGGVTLEIGTGYGSQASYMRDMLSVSRLIDIWSMLGVQIHVNVACPSSAEPDPLADRNLSVSNGVWQSPWSEESQADWLEQIVPLLLAKPSVTGVFLSQFSDSVPHRFPHAGLLSATNQVKKMVEPLRRQRHHDLS